MEGNTATLLEMGRVISVAEDSIRKGDILLFQAGDLIPADLKLVEARDLEVDEWDLTGQIAPVEKRADGDEAYVYRGSRVIRGNGQGVVVATGEETEYGHILRQPWEREKGRLPPLIKARTFWLLLFLLPPLVASLRQQSNLAWMGVHILLAAVVMVVAPNGELFKYILTAHEAKKLKARQVQVRDITALEVLGNIDIVGLDKTGVLTTRDIAVRRIYFAQAGLDTVALPTDGELALLTGLGCALCNDLLISERKDQATAIDRALIAFAAQSGFHIGDLVSKYQRIYDKPFNPEDRYMAAGFERGDRRLYFAKGDPEVVVRMCASYISTSGAKKLDAAFWRSFRTNLDSASKEGDGVIALAYSPGTVTGPPHTYAFLCLIQLGNPLNPNASEAVRRLGGMGIRTIMLSGDRPEIAMSIGRAAGIGADSGYYLTGKDIARMALSDVARQATHVSIFARLLPSQKGVLIRLLQQKDWSVAMVGDGANDTIALAAADVGLSFVEHASPFAKRVSKILLNDLADLVTIIRRARRIKWQSRCLMFIRFIALISVLWLLYAPLIN